MKIYVVPVDERRVVFPQHNAKLLLELERKLGFLPTFELPVTDAAAQAGFGSPSLTIRVSTSELIVEGPGSFLMLSEGGLEDIEGFKEEGLMTAHLKAAGSPALAVLSAKMSRMDRDGSVATWSCLPDMLLH